MDLKLDEKSNSDSMNSRRALDEEATFDPSVKNIDDDPVYSYKEQRAIIHRVDLRLVATCGFIYCFSLIDRSNLGAASIAGSVQLPLR